VKVLAHETLRERVEARGAEFVTFRKTYPDLDLSRPETDDFADWGARTPIGAAKRFRDRALRGAARPTAVELVELLDRWPAEAIVSDVMLVGAVAAADRAGVPAFVLVHCPYPLPAAGAPPLGTGLRPGRTALGRARDRVLSSAASRFYGPVLDTLNEVRGELGLAAVTKPEDAVASTAGTFVLTAPELDFTSRAALPGNVRYVGPAFEPVRGDWQPPWPETNRDPLVLISFSTTYTDQRALARPVLAAVSTPHVRALFTRGPALDLTGLAIPENTHVVPYAPHALVLPHASLAVTHAGFGTIQAALAAGVPLVCIPDSRDQPDNAARVLAVGAGLRVRKTASPERLRKTIEAALTDPALRERARQMSVVLGRSDGAAAVVDAVEAVSACKKVARTPRSRRGPCPPGAGPVSLWVFRQRRPRELRDASIQHRGCGRDDHTEPPGAVEHDRAADAG
jgi:UDP:flavonoid glycosyltransferase YjiC (YdhE family)